MTTLAEKRKHYYETRHNNKEIEKHLQQANMEIHNGRVTIGTASGLAVAGGEQAPVADADGRPGWLFTKALAGTAKFNYYYYSQGNKPVTLGELKGLHANVSIDNYQSIQSMPFFIVYTKPTGVGDAGAWFHSKVIYTLDTTENIILGEDIEIYSIKKQENNHSHKRMVSFNTKLVEGSAAVGEEILTISIHSDSGSPVGTQILVKNLGYEIEKDGETIIRRISLN